jgi:hypothetical protein
LAAGGGQSDWIHAVKDLPATKPAPQVTPRL